MLPFKKGVFHLAVDAQFPILPIAVSPLWAVLDARRWAVRPGTIRLRVLPPVPTEGLGPGDVAGAHRAREGCSRRGSARSPPAPPRRSSPLARPPAREAAA